MKSKELAFLLKVYPMGQVVDMLEYLGEAVLVLHNGGPFCVQQCDADEQVEVLAGFLGPQHLPTNKNYS
jgi:hypothetical protein